MEMKRILILLFLTLLAAGCAGKQPQISLDHSLELGDVVNGEVVVREVTVRNTGEADLTVEAVSTSCGCTSATLEPMTIPAGGSGVLTVELDSGAHGPDLTGELIRQVFIASNDADHSEAVLEIRVNILPPSDP